MRDAKVNYMYIEKLIDFVNVANDTKHVQSMTDLGW